MCGGCNTGTPQTEFARRSSGGGRARGRARGGSQAPAGAGSSVAAAEAIDPDNAMPLADDTPWNSNEDMDLREVCAEEIDDPELLAELEATFGLSSHTPLAAGDGGDGAPDAEPDEQPPDEEVVRSVAAGVLEALASVEGGGDASASASSNGDAAPPPPQPEVAAMEPWLALGETTELGYVYDAQPRSVMRIQRGKPKRSVTINCYIHTGCRMLLTEDRCPDDSVLKRWLFEVPAPSPGCSRDEARHLAEQHMALGKGRWGGKRAQPAA